MKTKRHLLFIVLACLADVYQVTAQGTAFSYQGRLNDNGSPANGLYDVRFMVWDAATNGNLVAGPLTNSATGVTNGLFAVMLDFGNGVFTGPARWLQLDVRTNGNGAFTTLLPFQQILPTPYAIMANTASNLLGTLSATQLSGTFTGDGAGLTNINAAAFHGYPTNAFDSAGTGTTAATGATNGLGSAAFKATSFFDLSGAALAATNNFSAPMLGSGALGSGVTAAQFLSSSPGLTNTITSIVCPSNAVVTYSTGALGQVTATVNFTNQPTSTSSSGGTNFSGILFTNGGPVLTNTVAATAGTEQNSPSITMYGNGWKTATTAASEPVGFQLVVMPGSGSSAPFGTLEIFQSINGGAWTDTLMGFSVNGTFDEIFCPNFGNKAGYYVQNNNSDFSDFYYARSLGTVASPWGAFYCGGTAGGTAKTHIDTNGNIITAGTFTGNGSGLTNINAASFQGYSTNAFDSAGAGTTAAAAATNSFTAPMLGSGALGSGVTVSSNSITSVNPSQIYPVISGSSSLITPVTVYQAGTNLVVNTSTNSFLLLTATNNLYVTGTGWTAGVSCFIVIQAGYSNANWNLNCDPNFQWISYPSSTNATIVIPSNHIATLRLLAIAATNNPLTYYGTQIP